jgi:hypothetical protein
MLLILGVALGSANAWYWVRKAREDIIKDGDDNSQPQGEA